MTASRISIAKARAEGRHADQTDNPYNGWKEPTEDQWCIPLLDNRNPEDATDEQREFRRLLRRMRKKARLADQLIATNKKLREQLRHKPAVSGSGVHHEPTDVIRNQVMTLAAMGLPQKDVAAFVGLNPGTLARHYAEELDLGRIGADIEVLETFKSVATDKKHFGVVAAGKKWLESRVEGWKPVQRVEHAKDGADGPPIIDSSKLNPEERAQLRALMEKMVAPSVPAIEGDVVAEQPQGFAESEYSEEADDDEDSEAA